MEWSPCVALTFVSIACSHLAVGMKLYGRKFNDIWYKGTLIDIQNKDRPRVEVCYQEAATPLHLV